MKKTLLLLIATVIVLFSSTDNYAQKKSSSYGYKTKSYNSYKIPKSTYKSNTYKAPKLKTYTPKTYTLPKSTYKSGSTTYYTDENYKKTGMPKVKRSNSARDQFLKQKGYEKLPKGYEVDHIIPLSEGGKDEPSNMQLLPKEVHKQKTANERKK